MRDKQLIRLERDIVIAMIGDDGFLSNFIQVMDPSWCQSPEARMLMVWIFDFYKKHERAPGFDIQTIYEDKLKKKKISDAQGEIIEGILQIFSDEAEDWDDDQVDYLSERTLEYCNACKVKTDSENAQGLLDNGDIDDAVAVLKNFEPVEIIQSVGITPFATDEQKKNMFEAKGDCLIRYPGDLGRFLNPYMIRSGFVIFLAQNKGGKSFTLMDAALRGAKQGRKVLFFQAGDMTQEQMELRMAIYCTERSDQAEYCNATYIPILDCLQNQKGDCELDTRNSDRPGPLEDMDVDTIQDMTFSDLVEAYKMNPRHKPCYECIRGKDQRGSEFKGSIWYRKRPKVEPLDLSTFNQFQRNHTKKMHSYFSAMDNIRIFTYPSDGLTMSIMEKQYDMSAKEGFEGDIVVSDYLDLYAPESFSAHMQPRDQENHKWKRGRKFSQDKEVLFMSASQSDAQGFDATLLSKKNFSEDRRKLDHVTGMIGMNMTITEKKLGLARYNEIASRDTDGTKVINVMQRLSIGRPILGSFMQ